MVIFTIFFLSSTTQEFACYNSIPAEKHIYSWQNHFIEFPTVDIQ
jgi:hypothetical protein